MTQFFHSEQAQPKGCFMQMGFDPGRGGVGTQIYIGDAEVRRPLFMHVLGV